MNWTTRSEAARWCFEVSGTLASHTSTERFSLASYTGRQVQNAPEQQAKLSFQARPPWSRLSRRSPRLRPVKQPSPAHRASLAYWASDDRRVQVPREPRASYPAEVTLIRADTQLRHFPAVAWFRREIPLRL